MTHQDGIIIKTPQQIENIRQSGKLLNQLLRLIFDEAKAGVSLMDLENLAEDFMQKHHVKGAFKNYNGFPCNLCLSVNACVVHGIPDDYVLQNGDVLKIDCGIDYHGGISDSALTKIIGGEAANPLGFTLAQATFNALNHAMHEVKPGISLFHYSRSVYDFLKKSGFSLITKLTGHGVGLKVHELPHIYNYPHKNMKKIFLKPGMVLAFEPITAITSTDFELRDNAWNLYCKDNDIGAHREYMVLITDTGYELLSGITEFLSS